MLKKVVITNYLGESMEYLIDGVQQDNPSGLIITSIEGLGPVKADINMTELTTTDGSLYNSSRLNGRNIVIQAEFTHANSIEEARLLSYKYFPIKKRVRIEVYTDNRSSETYGHVESNEPDIFSEKSGCQISILCESPYFYAIGPYSTAGGVFSGVIPMFKFPFRTIPNPEHNLGENTSGEETVIVDGEEITIVTDPTASVTNGFVFGTLDQGTTRVIEYDGDAEPGMELRLATSGDVTGKIAFLKDNTEQFALDTNKFSAFIPNTSPTNLYYYKGVFLTGEDASKWTYAQQTSFYQYYSMCCVPYNGKFHMIRCYDGTHLVLNELDDFWYWEEAEALPFHHGDSSVDTACCVADGKIFVFDNYHGDKNRLELYKWSEESGWEAEDISSVIGSFGTEYYYVRYLTAITYHDRLHLFGVKVNSSGSRKANFHLFRAGVNFWLDLSEQSAEAPSYQLSQFVVHNDRIYRLSQGNGLTISAFDDTFGMGEWIQLSTSLPSVYQTDALMTSLVVEFKGKLHILGGYHISSSLNAHYVLDDGVGEFIEQSEGMYETYRKLNAFSNSGVYADDNHIYLIGNYLTDRRYTEPANNVKMIKNDELVISTVQGKKGAYLKRRGITYNVLNSVDRRPSWFTLHRGDNQFEYEIENGIENAELTIYSQKLYEGM